MKATNVNNKGFTLVELSIVLVIIGLLIGGILSAQSMIKSSKIQGIVRQVAQYDIMFRNFRTQFNQLPGDSSLFSPAGDADGTIENADEIYSSAYTGELAAVWVHLQQAGFLNDGRNYTEVSATACPISSGNSPNFPKLNWSNSSSILVVWGDGAGSPTDGYYRLGDFTNANNTNYTTGGVNDIFTPADALAIDLKMDDGLNTSAGSVFAEDGGSRTTCGGSPTEGNAGYDCRFGNAYDASVSAIDCHLMIKWLPNER
jgi:prepilin-type N-terminal cleavage/methylation domain-containing protein